MNRISKQLLKIASEINRIAYQQVDKETFDRLLDAKKQGKKYILHHQEGNLWRIMACKDLQNGIKQRDFGGLLQSQKNLSHNGECWVGYQAKVYGNAKIFGNAQLTDNAQVYESAKIYGEAQIDMNAKVHGEAQVYDHAIIAEKAQVYEKSKVHGHADILGNAKIKGNAQIFDTTCVDGDAKIYGEAFIFGDAKIGGNAQVNYDVSTGIIFK